MKKKSSTSSFEGLSLLVTNSSDCTLLPTEAAVYDESHASFRDIVAGSQHHVLQDMLQVTVADGKGEAENHESE